MNPKSDRLTQEEQLDPQSTERLSIVRLGDEPAPIHCDC
jgi:hypothetical protein